MHDAGGRAISLDEASSVAFGLSKETIKPGTADQIMAPDKSPMAITGYGREL
jgi:chemotaxis response regulator CheB